MESDAYYFTICAFLLLVFAATFYLSYKGNLLAKDFLWTWASLLLIALPFSSYIPSAITDHIAGITFIFFVYTLFLIKRKNQKTLETAHEETRRVLAEANKRMDEERRRIARQLHDEINPNLLLAKIELQNLVPLINSSMNDAEHAEKAHDIVAKVLSSLTSVYQDCREIIRNTRIEIIDSIGLTTAIESLVNHYKHILERLVITLEHNLPKRPNIPLGSAVNAYRIIQEALLNAVKHADAAHITISVYQTGKRYNVSISDDGVGIYASKNEHGIGLIDMRERARVLGSDLRIESRKGKGTKVSFSFLSQD